MPEGYCFGEIISGRFPQSVSIMYRKQMVPNDIYEILKPQYKMGDYPLYLYLADIGKFKYISESTCVYRKNNESASGKLGENYLKNINFISSCREVLSDFTKKRETVDKDLLQKIEAQLQHWLLTSFSMSLQNYNTNLAKDLWIEIKENRTPTPFKYQLLHKSMYLGVLGKGLINSYYKK